MVASLGPVQHAKSHAHDGSDGSGTVSYTSLTSRTHDHTDHTNRTRHAPFIDAGQFGINGATSLVTDSQSRYFGYPFGDAVDGRVGFTFCVPADWVSGAISLTVCFYLVSNNTSKGIVWAWVFGPMTTPGTTSAINFTVASTETQTITANAEIYQEFTSSFTFTPGAAGEKWRFNFGRVGNNAADTVSGNVIVIGIDPTYTADM